MVQPPPKFFAMLKSQFRRQDARFCGVQFPSVGTGYSRSVMMLSKIGRLWATRRSLIVSQGRLRATPCTRIGELPFHEQEALSPRHGEISRAACPESGETGT